MIAIIDYDAGNLKSVEKALKSLNQEVIVSRDSSEILQADIPHMGWNSIEIKPQAKLFKDIPNQSYVYFVHSYYLKAQDEQIVAASTEYSTHIHASVESGNVFACQFHPEKSSDIGLQILKNFTEL